MSQQMTADEQTERVASEKARDLLSMSIRESATAKERVTARYDLLQYIASLEAQVSAPRPMEGSPDEDALATFECAVDFANENAASGLSLTLEQANEIVAAARSSREKEREARAKLMDERVNLGRRICELEAALVTPNGTVCSHGDGVLVTHISDNEPCSDFSRAVSLGASEEKGR